MRPRRSPQKDVRSPQKDVDCIPIVTGCKLKGVTRRYKCRIVQAQPFAYPWLTNNQQPAGAQCIQGYERMAYTKGRQCAICCCKYPTFFCLTKCPIQSDGRRQNIQVIRSHLTETSATFKNLYTFQAYFLGVPCCANFASWRSVGGVLFYLVLSIYIWNQHHPTSHTVMKGLSSMAVVATEGGNS